MCEKRTYKERLKQEAVIAQVKRRREMWREMMIENEGSLINKVMNGQLFAERDPEGGPEKDGGMNFKDCAASFIAVYGLCMYNNL